MVQIDFQNAGFRQMFLRNVASLLLLTNLIVPIFDRFHPFRWGYHGALRLLEGWIHFIGFVMSWFTGFLPRVFTFQGTFIFLFSTVITVCIFLLTYQFIRFVYKRTKPSFIHRGFSSILNTLQKSRAFWSILVVLLLGLLIPSLVRLF